MQYRSQKLHGIYASGQYTKLWSRYCPTSGNVVYDVLTSERLREDRSGTLVYTIGAPHPNMLIETKWLRK